MITNILKTIVPSALGFFLFVNYSFAQFTPAQNAYLKKNELLKNPDAENGSTGWVSSVKPEIALLDYFSGIASFEISLNNQTLSFCQSVDTTVKLQNALLSGTCRVKTDSDKIEICSVINGAVSACSPIGDTGEWELGITEDFATGSVSSGLCVRSTEAVTSIVRIDNCSLAESISSTPPSIGIIGIANGGTGLNNAGNVGDILVSTGTGYVLQASPTLPPSGAAGNFLVSNGISFVSTPLLDNVASINGVTSSQQYIEVAAFGSDVNIQTIGDTHTLNIPIASGTRSGKLSADDWNTFNLKLSGAGFSVDSEVVLFQGTLGNTFKRATGTGIATLTSGVLGNIPVGVSGKVIVSNGTSWVAGDSPAPTIPNATTSVTGLLTSTDWNRFNNATLTANSTRTGLLTSADWIRFDAVTSQANADAQTTGYLTSTDWVRFDTKANVGEVDLTGTTVGVLAIENGGTGLSTVGANNTYLKSNGTALVYGTLPLELPVSSTNGYVLTWNGSAWVGSPSPLELPPTATTGYVLTYNGSSWVASAPTGGGGGGNASIYTSSQLGLLSGGTITLDPTATIQQITVKASSGAITLSSLPFGSSAPADGTQIRIIGANSNDAVELVNNDSSKGVILNGNAILKKYHILTLVYNAELDRYIESGRNY